MNEPNDINPRESNGEARKHAAPTELDVLIGRIVDGEASDTQRRNFEGLAAVDASLWRRLALRQQDMSMLALHVEPTLNAAEHIELPTAHAQGSFVAVDGAPVAHRFASPNWQWWTAASGWAAVIAFAALWGSGILPSNRGIDETAGNGPTFDTRLTSMPPDEHLQEYMQAPYVMGEMPPTLLAVDELSDGRLAVSFLRRIVEVEYYNSPADIPLDENGLTASPREIRHAKAQPHPRP